MNKPLFLCFCLLLFLCPLVRGEEITLTFEESDMGPQFLFGLMPVFDDNDLWAGGHDRLTEDVETFQFSIPSDSFDREDWMLISVDNTGEGGKIVYLDLNRNKKIDGAEHFPLKIATRVSYMEDAKDKSFVTEKFDFPASKEGGNTFPVNLYCLFMPGHGDTENLIFGFTSWGCYKGEARLNDMLYKVTLLDQNMDGDFDDYQKDENSMCDGLLLQAKPVPENNDMMYGEPLRQKMFINNKTFSVAVNEGGKKLIIEPIQVPYGSVDLKTADVSVNLFSAEWGNIMMEQAGKKEVPAGTWKVSQFTRHNGDNNRFLMYQSSDAMNVEVKADQSAELSMATTLKSDISQSIRGNKVNLSLKLTTDQGANFASYYGGEKAFEGIPFAITNGAGETVHEGLFTFG
jgi:hypothetical protein